MYLTRVNANYIIIDTKYLEYNPISKTVNWNSKRTPSVMFSNMEAVHRAIAGQYNKAVQGESYLIHVSQPAKTIAQYQAECKKQAEAIKLAKQKANEAKMEAIKNEKKKHQEALTAAQQAGTLTSCKKMYWKYSFNPNYLYTETNPQPFKDVEGTGQSYCSLKDGSTAMLQFEDHKDSQSGAIYRAPKLMDFTGKTKYYPWD
ncbi:hypothetical protein IJ843_03430 [bacterium]|nr:hypothetical protein [bacterium]